MLPVNLADQLRAHSDNVLRLRINQEVTSFNNNALSNLTHAAQLGHFTHTFKFDYVQSAMYAKEILIGAGFSVNWRQNQMVIDVTASWKPTEAQKETSKEDSSLEDQPTPQENQDHSGN